MYSQHSHKWNIKKTFFIEVQQLAAKFAVIHFEWIYRKMLHFNKKEIYACFARGGNHLKDIADSKINEQSNRVDF